MTPTDKSLVRLCADRGVDIKDLDAVLKLYDDDRDEEEILKDLDKYPEAVRQLASFIILGI